MLSFIALIILCYMSDNAALAREPTGREGRWYYICMHGWHAGGMMPAWHACCVLDARLLHVFVCVD